MNYKILPSMTLLILAFGALFSFNNVVARNTPCQPIQEELAKLKAEVESVTKLNEILRKLNAGTKVPQAPLSVLFSIDVTEQNKVDKRRRELEESLADDSFKVDSSAWSEAALICPVEYLELQTVKSAVNAAREETARLKIAFFNQPADVRTALTSQQVLLDGIKASQRQLDSEITAQKKAKEKAQSDERIAAQSIESLVDVDQKELATANAQLEGVKVEIAEFHEKWLERIQTVVDRQKIAAEKIVDLSGRSLAAKNDSTKLTLYLAVVPLWRQLTDEGLRIFDLAYSAEDLPHLPPRPVELLARLKDQKGAENYEKSYAHAAASIAKLTSDYKKDSRSLAEKQYHIQDQAAELRAQLYQEVEGNPELARLIPLDARLTDYWREIRAIPYRAFGVIYTKYLGYKSGLDGSLSGVINVSRDIATLLVILLVPLVAFYAVRRAIQTLDRYRIMLSKKRRGRFSVALLLRRITPYLPWVTSLAVVYLTQQLIEATAVSELSTFIGLGYFWVFYRIFLLLVKDVFDVLRLKIEMTRDTSSNALVGRTAKVVGRFFFAAAVLLYVTKLAVGQVLVYGVVQTIAQFFGVIILAVAAYRWDFLIVPLAEEVLPAFLAKPLAKLCRGRGGYIFCLPTLVLILLTLFFQRLRLFVGEFDVSKRLAAKVYRRRIESRSKNDEGVVKSVPVVLDASYLGLFDPEGLGDFSLWASGNDAELAKVKSEIDEWLTNDSAEQSTAIYGEKGTGKTTLLNKLKRDYTDLDVIELRVPAKTTSRDACRKMIAGAFNLSDPEDLVKELVQAGSRSGARRMLVLIDEAHNLFLGTVGGFEAYLELVQIMNAEISTVFWCLAFNEHAWTFLQGYFAKNQHIRSVTSLSPWSDSEIAELIMKRHKASGIKLLFDQAILASQATYTDDDSAYAERQLFRLIWEQSKGNPRIAMRFWLTSLTPKDATHFRVSIPKEPDTRVFDRLTDEACFVYAAIARHENLVRSEIIKVLNLPFASVSLALKFGLENCLIVRAKDRRYRINPVWHTYVVAYLKRKNFLYGNE